MGGSEKSSRSSKGGGGFFGSHGHSSKDKGKGKEIASKGKGKGTVSQTIPEDDLMPSSLPTSSSLMGAGSQFASYPQNDTVYQQQSTPTPSYSQSAPTQEVAYSSYNTVQSQEQSYSYADVPPQQYTYPAASTANYVATSRDLVDPLGGLQLGPSAAQSIQYTTNASLQGRYQDTPLYYSGVGTGQSILFSSNYATQPSQGGPIRTSRRRSHGTATNNQAQNNAYRDSRAHHLLGEKNFRKHKSKDFALGRVLKIFWFEPTGSNAQQNQGNRTVATGGPYGGENIQNQINQRGKIRRFVIVETRKGHSTAVPIHTYNYQGTLKPGCHPEDHAMIYTNPVPEYLDGEDQIPHQKIRMAAVSGELLEPTSRINFAKKYTIEHNFLVDFIGQIAKNSVDDFWQALNTVNAANQLFTPPMAQASTSQSYTMRTSASVNIAGSSSSYQDNTPRSSQMPASQQRPVVYQSIDENGNPLTSEPPTESSQEGDRTPTNSQPSSSHRRNRAYSDDRERREPRYRRDRH